MVHRQLSLPSKQSFFLFGARGVGKSTLLRQTEFLDSALYIDLLKPSVEEKYALQPESLIYQARSLEKGQWVIIDEVQKVPKLLDVVHSIIEEKKIKFALTGSSSRKLKRGGANLLAGRAVTFSLYPLTSFELDNQLSLLQMLSFGTLPKLLELESSLEKNRYLRSYVQTYIKEEILIEQLVRNLDPFRLFISMAAQNDGNIINYSNIARETGVDHKTVQNYYQILVDTNLGFFLEPFARSIRQVQFASPKFYFFDYGVKRAIEKKLNVSLSPQTTEYGNAFENFFINECFRLNHYLEKDYILSYLRTKDDAEIDLIIRTPEDKIFLVEIKSTAKVFKKHLKHLEHFKKDFPKATYICACTVQSEERLDDLRIMPWKKALELIFDL